ncbi:MAG: hypothetical protein ABH831_00130 [Candidatus Nealsonbacteria bacterium]
MLADIKYHLFKIFSLHKKKVLLFSLLVFLGLFAGTSFAHAFILDVASVQLDALDFIDNSVLKLIVAVVLWAVESSIFLSISANLLDWSSSLPVGLDNPLVKAGWQFTSGIANLFFILIFVVIALAYILKLENLQMKKALPRLIFIAFLINFSLIFVQIFTDIGWIIQNSFKNTFFTDGSLAVGSIQILEQSSFSLITFFKTIVISYIPFALIPYGNVVALVAIAVLIFTTGAGPLIGPLSQIILVIVFNFLIGLVFFVYAILFLARISVIWLLAVLAPLAFMAYILPQTERYFKQWLDALIQWVFLGVVSFFLMGLGIALFALVAPGTEQIINFSGELGDWSFTDTFFKYLFLLIYLLAALAITKKVVPMGAQGVWGFGNTIMNKGINLAGGLAGTMARRRPQAAYVNQAEMTMRRRLERLPVLGRALGGPGALAIETDRERKRAGKDLDNMPPDDIRRVANMRVISREDRMRRARAMELLGEKVELQESDRGKVTDALRFGVPPGTIYKAMPHWDSKKPGDITKRIEKMDVGDFRTKVSSLAFESIPAIPPNLKKGTTGTPPVHTDHNLEVFYSMDMSKTVGLGRIGKKAQKEALWRLVHSRYGDIVRHIEDLRRRGTGEDLRNADKIENMTYEIAGSPNYRT